MNIKSVKKQLCKGWQEGPWPWGPLRHLCQESLGQTGHEPVNWHNDFITVQQVIQVYPHHYRKIKTWNSASGSLYLVNIPKEERRLIDQPPIFVQLTLIKDCHSFLLFSGGRKANSLQAKCSVPAPAAALTQSNAVVLASRTLPEGPLADTKAGLESKPLQTQKEPGPGWPMEDFMPWPERNITDWWAKIHGLQGYELKSLWLGAGCLPSTECETVFPLLTTCSSSSSAFGWRNGHLSPHLADDACTEIFHQRHSLHQVIMPIESLECLAWNPVGACFRGGGEGRIPLVVVSSSQLGTDTAVTSEHYTAAEQSPPGQQQTFSNSGFNLIINPYIFSNA